MNDLISRDALLNTLFEIHCKECERRKGIKRGKREVIYEIGEAPCKSCGVNDMREYLEDAPTADAVLIELKNVREVIDRYCTKYCSLAKYYFGRFKDVDVAMEHLERKCENCPLKEI